MAGDDGVLELERAWRDGLTPDPALSVSEWADRHRVLSTKASAEPGAWRTRRTPYLQAIMDCLSPHSPVERVVLMKAAQLGATEAGLNWIGFIIHHAPGPLLAVWPTVETAKRSSRQRIDALIADSPVLAALVAPARARDAGNTVLAKDFRGGVLVMTGANSAVGLRSMPARYLFLDEVDGYPGDVEGEGDAIALAEARTRTFARRKIFIVSTPTIKGVSRIEAAFEASDQRYFHVPCPHCDAFQRLVWSQVQWPDGQPAAAGYVCSHCGALWTDADKPALLARGVWRASRPFAGVAGFHVSALYSPWTTWAELATGFLIAKRLPETLQVWVNTVLGETWEERGEQVDSATLSDRREAYTPAHLPSGIQLLTRGTDVQDDRLESTLWGWGLDGEKWRVQHDVLRGSPGDIGPGSVWLDHDALLTTRYTTDDGRTLVCEACAVDSGGHFTEQVYTYCARRKGRRVWAIKGVAGPGRLAWPKRASRGGRRRLDVWPVGVDTVKDVLYGQLKFATAPGPGYTHFDAATEAEYLEQLLSETLVYRQVNGRRTKAWKPKSTGVRQEALDCWVYAFAAMVGRGGPELIRLRQQRAAARRAKAEGVPAPPEPPPVWPESQPDPGSQPPRQRRTGRFPARNRNWVNQW